LSPDKRRVRVDAHVHVWPHSHSSTIDTDPSVAAAGEVDALVATLPSNDVTAAVVVQPSSSGLDHNYLLAAVRTNEHLRLVGLAQAEPENPRSFELIADLTASGAVVGFRLPLIRAGDKWIQTQAKDYWELAAERRSVISVLTAPSQLQGVGRLAAAHPSVPVVIDHLARFDLAADRHHAIDQLCLLASLENVYVKVSALGFLSHEEWPYRDLWPILASVIDAFGIDRVMWGSDYPFVLAHGRYEDSFNAAEVLLRDGGAIGQEDIMGGNALRVFFDLETQPS
jgi:L-fuconolactonase